MKERLVEFKYDRCSVLFLYEEGNLAHITVVKNRNHGLPLRKKLEQLSREEMTVIYHEMRRSMDPIPVGFSMALTSQYLRISLSQGNTHGTSAVFSPSVTRKLVELDKSLQKIIWKVVRDIDSARPGAA